MTFIQNTSDSAPWLDNPISARLRIVGFVAVIFLFGLILWSALALIVPIVSVIQVNVPLEAYMIKEIGLPLIGVLLGLYGWLKVRRYAFGPYDFRPRISVPATVLGQSIDIVMTKPIRGIGSLHFTDSRITIQAEGHTAINLGTDLVVDLIFAAINYLLFKSNVNIDLSYEQIAEIKIAARQVSMLAREGKAQELKFIVSILDGERLYRELNAHYPSAIQEWAHLFLAL